MPMSIQAASVDDVPPIIATPHHYLINIYRNQLYYVAVVTTEGKLEIFHLACLGPQIFRVFGNKVDKFFIEK